MDRRTRRSTLALCLTVIISFTILQLIVRPGPSLNNALLVGHTFRPPAFAGHLRNHPQNASYPLQELDPDDYNRLIDFAPFNFTVLHSSCNESSPLLLVLIHSAPQNTQRRNFIRETWGQKIPHVLLLFALGQVSPEAQKLLDAENATHGDFIQGNFVDSYQNVTYKHAMVFKYAIYHCPTAKYILKTDDDVFVNVISFLELVRQEQGQHGAHDLMFCNVCYRPIVNRSFRSKWRVSFREYANDLFPEMCPGWAVLYSPDVLFKLYKALQKAKYFWIDDVLITGILRMELNLTLQNNAMWVLPSSQIEAMTEDAGFIFDPMSFLFAPYNTDLSHKWMLWNYTKRFTHGKRAGYVFQSRNASVD